jgi:hypothetical protein
MNCGRCGLPLLAGQRVVPDPCCSAPDCEHPGDQSHYDCLPRVLQQIEDDLAEMQYP